MAVPAQVLRVPRWGDGDCRCAEGAQGGGRLAGSCQASCQACPAAQASHGSQKAGCGTPAAAHIVSFCGAAQRAHCDSPVCCCQAARQASQYLCCRAGEAGQRGKGAAAPGPAGSQGSPQASAGAKTGAVGQECTWWWRSGGRRQQRRELVAVAHAHSTSAVALGLGQQPGRCHPAALTNDEHRMQPDPTRRPAWLLSGRFCGSLEQQ